jgi:hypothetical protein
MSSPRKSPYPVGPTLPPMGLPSSNTPTISTAKLWQVGAAVTPGKCLQVLTQNDTGRNVAFLNRTTGAPMDRPAAVQAIKDGLLPEYYVRVMNGLETPVSKPDQSVNNNLR